MRHLAWSIGLALTLLTTAVSAHGPAGEVSPMFEAYRHGDMPSQYKGRRNPLAGKADAVRAGMRLYEENCVMCHGPNALGNGHMAAELEKKPSNLRMMLHHFPDADDYYFWVVSEGGVNFDSPMPSYKDQLSETEIWQIVGWMQAGFPGAGTEIRDTIHHQHMMPGGHMMDGHMPGMMGAPAKRNSN